MLREGRERVKQKREDKSSIISYPQNCYHNSHQSHPLHPLLPQYPLFPLQQQLPLPMAQTIQYYQSDLTKCIDQFQDYVTKSPYQFSNRQKWLSDCSKKSTIIKDLTYRYQYELNQLPKDQNTIYAASLKTLESRFLKATQTLASKKGQKKPTPGTLFDEREEEKPIDQMNVHQVIDHGHNLQNKMVGIIEGMGITLEQGLLLADEINLKLEGQIEQLNRMTETVKDTGSTLKKAQKHIGYFKKALQCDKWLAALFFLNLIALVTLIVLIVKKVKK